jgi:hypothetical protein
MMFLPELLKAARAAGEVLKHRLPQGKEKYEFFVKI